jgi:hypothetical protein
MDWGRIAVACRVGQKPDAEFFRCWTRLVMGGLRDGDAVLTPVIEMLPHYAADSLAKGFLRGDCDSILFIDDDMVFSNSDLDTLRDDVDGFEYDGLMGLCQSRKPPHKSIIMQNHESGKFLIPAKPPEGEIVDVGIVGLGFTLLRREIFEKMQEPYFYFSERGDGEDATFSINANKLGFKLGVSTRVQIGHRFPVSVKWNFEGDALQYLSTNNETQKGG